MTTTRITRLGILTAILTVACLVLIFTYANLLGDHLATAQAKAPAHCWQTANAKGGARGTCRIAAQRFTWGALAIVGGPLDTTRCRRTHGHYRWTCVTYMSSGYVVRGGITAKGTLSVREV